GRQEERWPKGSGYLRLLRRATDGSLIHPTPLEGPGRRGPGHTHRVPRAHSHHETATPATPLASVMFRAFPPAAISDRASMDARTTIAEAKSSAIVMRRRGTASMPGMRIAAATRQ